MIKKISVFLCCLFLQSLTYAAGSPTLNLKKVHFDQKNIHSLQRGAKWFMNACAGCHSLRYARYKALGEGIQLFDEDDRLDEKLLKKSFIFSDRKVGDLITNAMPSEDAKNWFGRLPPDLTLEARVRGSDWIYHFLLGFYYDPTKPRNVNNLVYPDVGMPHVLQPLEGIKVPVFHNKTVEYLQPYRPGLMTEQQYQSMVYDIVNFLTYIAEPMQKTRIQIGWFVLGFLFIFTLLAYLLKRAYWEDVH